MSLQNLLNLQKQKAAVESTASPKPVGKLGLNLAGTPKKVAPKAEAPAPKKVDLDSGAFTLNDLAGLDASTIEEPVVESVTSDYADEIEATAPERALDPDLESEHLAFVDSLNGIYQVLHDPELFGQAVRIIMMELQEHEEYEKLLADEDVHVMIHGMRRTMGLARVKKQSKKRGAATQKDARKKAGVSDAAMALLDSLMGDDAGDT